MGGALDIAVRRERGVVVVAVTGDVDISTVSGLRDALFKPAGSGRTLIVDLNGVTFIDSAGLGALVGAYRRAAERRGSMYAVCARPQIRRLLWLTGVDRRIPLAVTTAGALTLLAATREAPGGGPHAPSAVQRTKHRLTGIGRGVRVGRNGMHADIQPRTSS